ncbi:MAG: MFS transporter [Armatimonadetes bacterium]|nr:MFS transporter [Armatimonadota bacterium]
MRTFLTVWAGQLVSLLGSGLTNFGLGVWVYQKTGSATMFAMIGVLAVLPGLLAAPLAGVIVDRTDRRLVMLAGDVACALAVVFAAVAAWSGTIQVWHVMVLAFVTSTAAAFQVPAYAAAVSTLVPKEQLARTASMIQAGQAVADLAAPILGGLLFLRVGLHGLIFIDFVSFFAAIATLMFVRFPKIERPDEGTPEASSFKAEFKEGLGFIRSRPGLLILLAYFATLNFLLPMAGVLFAPLILSIAGPDGFGTVSSVLGAGMLAGSLIVAAKPPKGNSAVLVAVAGIATGAMIAGVGLRPDLLVIGTFGFLMMATVPLMNGPSQAIWQTKVPHELQGRVFSVRRMIAQATVPVAMIISGPLVDQVVGPAMMPGGALAPALGGFLGTGPGRGAGLVFVTMGVLTVMASLIALASPKFRNVESDLPDAVPATAAT